MLFIRIIAFLIFDNTLERNDGAITNEHPGDIGRGPTTPKTQTLINGWERMYSAITVL